MLDVFLVSLFYVGLKACQQINVVRGAELGPTEGRGYFVAVFPVSLCLACAEVYIVGSIVVAGWDTVLPLGFGAGLGCLISMSAHHAIMSR